jgi:hypothetical protein
MIRNLFTLVALAAIASCTKPTAEGSTQNDFKRTVKYFNTSTSVLHANFYKTKEDYMHSTMPVYEKTVQPGDTLHMEFNTGELYYIDWFTEDSRFTNWGIDLGGSWYDYERMILSNEGVMYVHVGSHPYGQARSFFIDGNKAMAPYIAIDYRDGGNHKSVWSTLPAYEKKRRLLLGKDMSYRYTFYTSETDSVVPSGKYRHTNDGSGFLSASLLAPNTNVESYFLNNKVPIGQKLTYDTLYLRNMNQYNYFVFIREK